MIEFSIQQTSIKNYQAEYLIKQINEAVNDEIFEMYTKSELDRIKKHTTMKTNKSNKRTRARGKRDSTIARHLFLYGNRIDKKRELNKELNEYPPDTERSL